MVLHRYEEALGAFNYLPARPYRVAAYMAGCHARLADMERAKASAAECLAMSSTRRSAGAFSRCMSVCSGRRAAA